MSVLERSQSEVEDNSLAVCQTHGGEVGHVGTHFEALEGHAETLVVAEEGDLAVVEVDEGADDVARSPHLPVGVVVQVPLLHSVAVEGVGSLVVAHSAAHNEGSGEGAPADLH